MLTRDSILFSWLAVVIAIAGYFATGADVPWHYTFQQWMQAVVAIGGIITAKLGSSPLPHSADASTVNGGR